VTEAAPASPVTYRPATEADLPACEATWRDGLNDYLVPMGQYEIPADNPSLRLLHAHALATDPERFWVATRADGGVIGFASAVRRGPVWFLSMLFVRPGEQARGVGRELLQRVLPADGDDATLATATDAGQPISNGLYAVSGIVPRLPMFNLIGRPTRPEALAPLPAGVVATRIDEAATDRDAGLAAAIDGLDATTVGFRHPEDHAFVRRQGRVAFAYRDGRGDLIGYGYTSEVGRLGPLATRDPALHAPIVAHLLGAIEPRGASAIWISGAAAETMRMLVGAGLRIEGFPVLVCWSRPFADFARYVPISPGLL